MYFLFVLRWKDQPEPQAENSYSYNPCSGFSEGGCTDVAMCQTTNDGNYFNLGTQDSAVFFSSAATGQLFLEYNSTDSMSTTRTSTIFLQCVNSSTTNVFTALGETKPGAGMYMFTLSSPHACPVKPKSNGGGGLPLGLSYGSLISIGVGVIVAIYLVTGVVVQKAVLNKDGKRIIPNYNLWTNVASLVWDGIKFSVTCGRHRTARYDSI